MADSNDLKYIKKHYGEKFAQLCRSFFPTILARDGELVNIITTYFSPNKELYNDIIKHQKESDFKDFVYSKFIKQITTRGPHKKQDPFQLMKKAGYTLYECKKNQDVLAFKKYWAKGEELCTFRDPQRILTNYIFFAVKRGAKKLNRDDFVNPLRQDEYGTSVISLQFTRGEFQYLSIKNRYNHSVVNPDCTFSNDLENIIAGLTDAFIDKYNFEITQGQGILELPGYITDANGKFYRFNMEVGGIYYCPNNITVRNGVAQQWDKNVYEVMDCYILNTQTKEMVTPSQNSDPFPKQLSNIEKVDIVSNKAEGTRDVIIKTAQGTQVITLNARSQIVGYYNPYIERLESCFMFNSKKLKTFSVPNVKTIESQVLMRNTDLEVLEVPEALTIGGYFLALNTELTEVNLPKVKQIGVRMLYVNKRIRHINMPEVTNIGSNAFFNNQSATEVVLPKAQNIGGWFMQKNRNVKIYADVLSGQLGSRFLPLSASKGLASEPIGTSSLSEEEEIRL